LQKKTEKQQKNLPSEICSKIQLAGFANQVTLKSADRTWERNNTRQKVNSECNANIAKDAGNIKNLCFKAVVDVVAELLMFKHMISMF